MNNIFCYVAVTGEPSDAEDDEIPGVYQLEVQLPSPVDLAALTPAIETAIAKAVLDEFHESVGIACLDDFDIQVLLPDGTPISEADLGEDLEAALSGFPVKATHDGSVDPDELPFDFEGRTGQGAQVGDSARPGPQS